MYRIFCESFENCMNSFNREDARQAIAKPLELITDVDKFDAERGKNSLAYQKLCDTLYYASRNIDRYPRLQAFLWTVSSRGMVPQHFGVSDDADMEEQVKLIHSILKLAYW